MFGLFGGAKKRRLAVDFTAAQIRRQTFDRVKRPEDLPALSSVISEPWSLGYVLGFCIACAGRAGISPRQGTTFTEEVIHKIANRQIGDLMLNDLSRLVDDPWLRDGMSAASSDVGLFGPEHASALADLVDTRLLSWRPQ